MADPMAQVWFDEEMADRYDDVSAASFRPEVLDPAVDFLHQLAGNGAALEFGVGTGRVALPLSERGVRVHGIDNSEPMIERLRTKPNSEDIGCTVGDFASTGVEGEFELVYLVFNTITNLTTQEEQVACFRNAAAHLRTGGSFVIEVFVPDLKGVSASQRIRPVTVGPDRFSFDEYVDFTGQILRSHHHWVEDGTLQSFSAPFRYVWPAELDLMAQLAGMELRERWATWTREPFADESTAHVSVWEKG